jgi:hypothetical protein
MQKLTLRVIHDSSGYRVVAANTFGPFLALEHALDLAYGMAATLHENGVEAEVLVEITPRIP